MALRATLKDEKACGRAAFQLEPQNFLEQIRASPV
jgi:hypothetical protein